MRVTYNAKEMSTFPVHDMATPINDDVETLARAPNIDTCDSVQATLDDGMRKM